MGMAASQARFLGLTARKSNVEFQVQQINQQRTSLANESAGLYNQMMTLDVPTPPSPNDYITTYGTAGEGWHRAGKPDHHTGRGASGRPCLGQHQRDL